MTKLPDPSTGNFVVGQETAETELVRAIASNRLHHAWIFAGPRASGKATMAYRMARYLLSGENPSGETLDCDPQARACRQIEAGAHPSLHVVAEPEPEPGKRAGLIPVEEIRKTGAFLASTSGEGDWRVVIIDTVDGLNQFGQNALLKMLEEPPRQTVFVLISNQPGRLLPTIRSRCRVLRFAVRGAEDIARILVSAGYEHSDELEAAITIAEGDLERAAQLLDGDFGIELAELAAFADQLPAIPAPKLLKMAEKAGGRGGDQLFDLLMDVAFAWLRNKARQSAVSNRADQVAPFAALWEKVAQESAQTRGFNLDRANCVLNIFSEIENVMGERISA